MELKEHKIEYPITVKDFEEFNGIRPRNQIEFDEYAKLSEQCIRDTISSGWKFVYNLAIKGKI